MGRGGLHFADLRSVCLSPVLVHLSLSLLSVFLGSLFVGDTLSLLILFLFPFLRRKRMECEQEALDENESGGGEERSSHRKKRGKRDKKDEKGERNK